MKKVKFLLLAVLTLVTLGLSNESALAEEVKEKDKLYMEVLARHNAVIKELSAQVQMGKERSERLLAYDTALKKKMDSLLSEKQELLDRITELTKKKANDE